MTNMRIVISCVSFETVKVLDPIDHYRADKVYLIHSGMEYPYIDFFNEVKRQLEERNIPYEERDIFYADFATVMKEVRGIIKKERKEKNFVYVNIGAGPQVYSSAAMMASMMEGGIPFNAPTEEFTVKEPEKIFYENGKPVGNASKVKEPMEIPIFKIQPPDPDLIKGLRIWKDITRKYKSMSTTSVMEGLNREGMLDDIWEDERRKKRSQSALMRYRRNFLEKWEDENWIFKDSRGRYSLTDHGEMMLKIFGDDR